MAIKIIQGESFEKRKNKYDKRIEKKNLSGPEEKKADGKGKSAEKKDKKFKPKRKKYWTCGKSGHFMECPEAI